MKNDPKDRDFPAGLPKPEGQRPVGAQAQGPRSAGGASKTEDRRRAAIADEVDDRIGSMLRDDPEDDPSVESGTAPDIRNQGEEVHAGSMFGEHDDLFMKERIGYGGMAEVWRAGQIIHGEVEGDRDMDVAVKVFHLSGMGSTARDFAIPRFEQEGKLLRKLRNPHVVQVYAFGVTRGGKPYFVMEYLDGRTLEDVIEQEGRPLPIDRAIHIARQIASALSAAHEKDIIHRDLKPGNVMMVKRDGDKDFVKVLDFGIAKVLGENRLQATGPLQPVGTPPYMAHEQLCGEKIDARVDVYTLGVILYAMLTGGRLPFGDKNLIEIVRAQESGRPLPPSEWNDAVSPSLDALILSALSINPNKRPASMTVFASALKAAVQSGKARAEERSRRLLFAVLFALLMLVGLGTFFLGRNGGPAQAPVAVQPAAVDAGASLPKRPDDLEKGPPYVPALPEVKLAQEKGQRSAKAGKVRAGKVNPEKTRARSPIASAQVRAVSREDGGKIRGSSPDAGSSRTDGGDVHSPSRDAGVRPKRFKPMRPIIIEVAPATGAGGND